MRPTELVPQFAVAPKFNPERLAYGICMMILGLFQKVVLADGFLAPAVEKVYDADKAPMALDAWAATLAFSGQIFCDFAGYSTTAIGVAMCMNFAMPDNFRFPYAAVGFSDFWRRWHITLSSWLRDYLYIPLGGNRRGEARTYLALMTTMLLGGLWHGANWTFVVWGGLHGLYLIGERLLRKTVSYRPGPLGLIALGLLTFLLTNIAWVFFRAKAFAKAWSILTAMSGMNASGVPLLAGVYLATTGLIVTSLVGAHWIMRERTLEATLAKIHPAVIVGGLTLMTFAITIEHGTGNAFIYFQF